MHTDCIVVQQTAQLIFHIFCTLFLRIVQPIKPSEEPWKSHMLRWANILFIFAPSGLHKLDELLHQPALPPYSPPLPQHQHLQGGPTRFWVRNAEIDSVLGIFCCFIPQAVLFYCQILLVDCLQEYAEDKNNNSTNSWWQQSRQLSKKLQIHVSKKCIYDVFPQLAL